MTHRQRALAALRGEPIDRVPFIARMELWYHSARNHATLPERYRAASLWELQRDLDIGICGIGPGTPPFHKLRQRTVEVTEETRGGEQITTYHTPHGTLRSRMVLTSTLAVAEVQGLPVEAPFKSPADYDAVRFLIDDLEVLDNADVYGPFVESIGEDGLAAPQTGYVPIHRLMHHYLGYESFYFELNDHPDQVLALHEALWAKYLDILDVAARCAADLIEVGGNYDEFLTPPPLFDKHIKPFYAVAREKLHAVGKLLAVHGDGEMRRLLTCLRDAGVDAVEALTPAPMTSIDLRRLRELWQGRVTLWGGIASVVLTPTFSQEAFEQHLDELFAAVAPGERFILGFGDNVPTDAEFVRVEQIARWVREHGACPLSGTPLSAARV